MKGLELVQDSFVVHVVFRNDSDRLLVVSDLELELPAAFVGGERGKTVNFTRGAVSIKAHSSQETEASIPSISFKESLGFCLFRSREYFATLKFTEKDPEGGVPNSRTVDVSLKAQAPSLAVVFGGLIGVPAIIFFLRLYEKYQGKPSSTFKPSLRVSLFLGWLVVVIAVFLFRFSATEIPQLPIAIHVKDFYGGVLLGMAYEPLARVFAKSQ